MLTDPIGDMITRIRNAHAARHDSVEVPFSKIKFSVAQVLVDQGYVAGVKESEFVPGSRVPRAFRITLKYVRDRVSSIEGLRRVSKPGRRVYIRRDSIPQVRSGMGIGILSTSVGVMTDAEARAKGVGGELICEVW